MLYVLCTTRKISNTLHMYVNNMHYGVRHSFHTYTHGMYIRIYKNIKGYTREIITQT